MRGSRPVFAEFCSIVFFLCFFHSSASSSRPPTQRSQVLTCNSKDSDALLGFSTSLKSSVPRWPRNASSNCCRWPGVRCGAVSSSSQNSSVSDSRVVGLELGGMGLAGAVSGRFLVDLDQLRALNLSSNSLSGAILAELFPLRQLEVVDLSNNLFSGDLTVNRTGLRHLDISFNSFSGSIPNLLFHGLRTLQRFSARANSFTGPLPTSLSSCSMLTSLDLANNSLTGEIELDFTQLVHLRTLRLESNRFTGHIPRNLSSCRRLETLDVAHNSLSGQIPRSFKNLQALSSFSLSNNGFSNVSRALAILSKCRNLTVLLLSANFFGDTMPDDGIVGFQSTKVLVVAKCSLRGSIPLWLRTCDKLRLLDLSHNRLAGDVPPWLGTYFIDLRYLNLSNNSFGGSLPNTLAHMKCLASEDCLLADRLPLQFSQFRGRDRSVELKYNGVFFVPPLLDLSLNVINGPILKDFGSSKWLHFLDLGNNSLSGPIPEELSGMRSLESLDLSHNNLSGGIPSSLVRLTFLSYFSVAYNHLQGKVPTSNQFLTFSESSFEGNPGLCFHGKCFPFPTPGGTDMEESRVGFMVFPYGIGVLIGFVPTAVICGLRSGFRTIKKKERRE